MADNSADDYKLYTIEKDGKSVRLKSSQLRTRVLSKVFGLFPQSIILLSQDGYVEMGSSDGLFHDVDNLPVWTVSGDPLQSTISLNVWTEHYVLRDLCEGGRKGRGKSFGPQELSVGNDYTHSP